MILYHVTSEKKAKHYGTSKRIFKPVRGFTTIMAALAWAVKANRKVIYEITGTTAYKLPDHHNQFGEAWWFDEDIIDFKCVFSAVKDA